MADEFDKAEAENLKRRIKETIRELDIESSGDRDIDDEGSDRYGISRLAFGSDNTTITNKINEIINEFNKSLINNRI